MTQFVKAEAVEASEFWGQGVRATFGRQGLWVRPPQMDERSPTKFCGAASSNEQPVLADAPPCDLVVGEPLRGGWAVEVSAGAAPLSGWAAPCGCGCPTCAREPLHQALQRARLLWGRCPQRHTRRVLSVCCWASLWDPEILRVSDWEPEVLELYRIMGGGWRSRGGPR